MQLSLHIKPCGCRRTFTQEGIRVPAGRDFQVVPGKHGPLRFQMILECLRALTGMPPFVVVMEEGRYSLWRLRADDDDDDDDGGGD